MTSLKRQHWIIIIVLSTILCLGAAIRLHNLTARSIGHNETYTPGIDLPLGLSTPRPRLTVWHTLSSLLHENEPHPPGYYLLMLGWTKIFGSSILALRLPSVIAGVLSILLIFLLGYLESDKKAGLLAAALLATNGYHMFWSQIAKNYAMSCFFGLLATTMLLFAYREDKEKILAKILYLVTSLLGMSMTVWFWPIFATHMIWVLIQKRRQPTLPGLLSWQMLALILGSPLLSLAVFQGNQDSYLPRDFIEIIQGLGGFVGLGFLFESDPFGMPLLIPVPAFVKVFVIALGLFLLGAGLYSGKEFKETSLKSTRPPIVVLIISCIVAFVSILLFAVITPFVFHNDDPSLTRSIYVTSIIPWFLLALHTLLQRYWSKLPPERDFLTKNIGRLRFTRTVSAYLAILPITMILAVTFFKPLFVARGVLLYVPYLLLVISVGLTTLVRRSKYWLILAAILALVYPVNVLNYKYSYREELYDYKTLTEVMMPRIEDDDLIFVRGYDAMETPVFYYLKAENYNFIGNNYSQTLRQKPDSRVWFLQFEMEMRKEMEEALKNYKMYDEIEISEGRAILYVRDDDAKLQPNSAIKK